MKQLLNSILIVLATGLSACVHLDRHPNSGYAHKGLQSAPGAQLSERAQLIHAERLLNQRTLSERRQYYRYRSALKSDRERLAFLAIPSLEARERWALNRGLVQSDQAHSEQIADLIESKDIALGMGRTAVQQSWGEPESIEFSGDPIYGNERWRYTRLIGSQAGYNRQIRYVYFESGRVIGWESL